MNSPLLFIQSLIIYLSWCVQKAVSLVFIECLEHIKLIFNKFWKELKPDLFKYPFSGLALLPTYNDIFCDCPISHCSVSHCFQCVVYFRTFIFKILIFFSFNALIDYLLDKIGFHIRYFSFHWQKFYFHHFTNTPFFAYLYVFSKSGIDKGFYNSLKIILSEFHFIYLHFPYI